MFHLSDLSDLPCVTYVSVVPRPCILESLFFEAGNRSFSMTLVYISYPEFATAVYKLYFNSADLWPAIKKPVIIMKTASP